MQIGFVPASSNTAGVAGHDADQDPKDIIKAAITAGYRYCLLLASISVHKIRVVLIEVHLT